VAVGPPIDLACLSAETRQPLVTRGDALVQQEKVEKFGSKKGAGLDAHLSTSPELSFGNLTAHDQFTV
jgi:hypothetical protein